VSRAPFVPSGSFLALVDELADVGLAAVVRVLRVRAARDVRRVQERRALEPELDERGLHAGQHARHSALVDVADEAAPARTLDLHFLQHAAFDESGTNLARRGVDQDFFALHDARAVSQKSTPCRASNAVVSNKGKPTTAE
jgi:hypothetical protein